MSEKHYKPLQTIDIYDKLFCVFNTDFIDATTRIVLLEVTRLNNDEEINNNIKWINILVKK